MKCNNCGFTGDQDFVFCPTCGAKYESLKKESIKSKAKSARADKKQPALPKSEKNKFQWVFILLAVIAVGALAIFVLNQITKGANSEILLLLPKSATKSDVVLVKSGDPLEKGTKLLKGITVAKGTITNNDKFPQGGSLLSSPGSFSLDGKSIYITYQQDTDQFLDQFNVQSKEGKTLYDSGYTFNSVILPNSQNILIKETRTITSCEMLLSANGNEAKRLVKGKTCSFSTDGSTFLITESDTTGILSLSVAKVSDPEKTVDILSQEKGILTYNLSADGSLLYVSKNVDMATQAVLYDTSSGDKLVESKIFEFKYASKFSAKGHGFYLITEDEKGNVDLSIFDGAALVSIKSGTSIGANFNEEGTHLAYVIGADKISQTAYIYDLKAQTEKEIVKGKSISFSFLSNPQRLLIKDNVIGEVTLYSTDLSGSTVLEVFSKAGYAVNNVFHPLGQNKIFILISKGEYYSLFTSSLDKEDGFFLVEDFYSIAPLTTSKGASVLIFSGGESSSKKKSLYMVEVKKDAEPEELEDDGTSYTNAAFTADEKSILYTMKTGTDRTDSVVRSVALKEGSKPVDLYEEAIIQDISWGKLYPWETVLWTTQTISGMSVCADAKELSVTQGQIESNIAANQNDCFKISLTINQPVSFHVANTAGVNVSMNIIDRAGKNYATGKVSNVQNSNETQTSLVYYPTKTGVFYLKNSASKSVAYTLDVNIRKNSFTLAKMISSGQTLTGAIGKEDYFIDRSSTQVNITGFGTAYYFNGQAGQSVTIDWVGKTTDPTLSPRVSLYSSIKKLLTTGQFTNNKDGSLTFELPATGRYYILFQSDNLRYGYNLTQSFDFQISLQLE